MYGKQIDRIKRRLYKKPNGCIGWYGATDTAGFPTTYGGTKGKNDKVHRVLYARANPGVDITGLYVRQTCLDRGCLNTDHMEHLTKQALERKKSSESKGSKRLSWDIVRAIRATPGGTSRRGQPDSTAAWAERTGVSKSTIRLIRRNGTWRQ